MRLLFLLLMLAQPVMADDKAFLLDGTAGTVGKTLLTVQDAYFYRALLRYKDGDDDALVLESKEELRKTVQKMMFEEMVFAELKSLQFDGGPRTAAEVLLRQQKTKGREGLLKKILARFGKTEAMATQRLWQNLQVEKFIQKKVETLTPIITEAEIERYFQQNAAKYKESDYEALKPSITVLLKKQRMQKGLEEWIRSLRDKYGVTNHLDG